jgi:uncharacterized pyridoxamine 5'-phosphate oxidase family protein
LVKFNSIGEYTTEKQEIIKELKKNPKIEVIGEEKNVKVVDNTTNEVEQPLEPQSEQGELQSEDKKPNLSELKELYFEKMGKRPYH